MLVEHPCTGLSSHGGQAVFRQSQRLARSQRGNIGRPSRAIDDGLRGARDGVSCVGRCRAVGRGDGSQVRQDGAGGHGLARHDKVRAHGVIPIHSHGGSSVIVGTAINPVVALTVFESEAIVIGLQASGQRIIISETAEIDLDIGRVAIRIQWQWHG